jgi:FkbM family methyltransferase
MLLKNLFRIFGYSFYKTSKPRNESDIIYFQIQRINPDLFIDCGANKGGYFHNIIEAGFTKKIILLEPNINLVTKYLSPIAENNKNVKVYNLGTGNKNCKKKFYITNDKNSDLSSFKEKTKFFDARFYKTKVRSKKFILIKRLDSLLKDNKIDKNNKIFIKIDTQGFDMETLLGLGDRIKQVYLIKIELSIIHLYKKSAKHWEILSFLKKKSFEPIYFLNGQRDKLGRLVEYDCYFIKNKIN